MHRLTVQRLAAPSCFFATVRTRVEALDVEQADLTHMIPAIYLERVAERSHAVTRHRLQALRAQLRDPLRRPTHPLQALMPALRARFEEVAGGCADLFQRSSSCVEGRNGHVSPYHLGCHRLSDRKLAVLTAIHNFAILRPDDTTAAERFFGRPHPSLFEQVLAQVSFPPPACQRRPRPPRQPYLTPLAA